MNKPTVAARVLVIQPDPADPLDRFEGWLRGLGVRLEIVQPSRGDAVPTTLDAEGLIVLGGKMGAYEDAEHPWFEAVRTLQRDAVAQGAPTLGICLGGQLLSQAFGGTVVPGPQGVEAGLVTVTASEATEEDPLLGELGPEFPVASMHGDMIETLPADSVLLGSSVDYPHQAFRVEDCAWGLQFHPEIAPATYAVWAGIFSSPDAEQMRRVADGVDELVVADPSVQGASVVIATRFARLVTEFARLRAAGCGPDGRNEPASR